MIPGFWILICFVFNAVKTSLLDKINGVLTFILIVVCAMYVFFLFNHVDVANFKPFIGRTMGAQGTIAAIPIAMLAYGSIIVIASIAGEIKKPRKAIPRIVPISVFLTIAVYAMILATVFGMAPVEEFIQDPSGQYYPLAYALLRNSGDNFTFLLMVIPFGALLAISTPYIKTSTITFEFGGVDGTEGILLVDDVPEANAIVSGGSIEKVYTIPDVDRVVGGERLRLNKEAGGFFPPADKSLEFEQTTHFYMSGNQAGASTFCAEEY